MSGVHHMKFGQYRNLSRGSLKDFTVATPEEFVKKFGGDRFINKVSASLHCSHFLTSVLTVYYLLNALLCGDRR